MATTKVAAYLTVPELAAELGFKRTKIYSLIDLGMPYRSLSPSGRTKRFVLAEVLEWLDTDRKVVRGRPDAPAHPGPGRPRKGVQRPKGATFGDYRDS